MGEMVELDPHYTTIGRGLTATVRINDEGISRTHAAVTVDKGVYYLSDAGSTNGTFANGERVDRYPLREGDKIQLGAASVLRFTFNEDSEDDLQRDLYESTLRDRLTGLFSRSYLENRLESDVAMALRHGKPTLHLAFDEATAVLAGDALQAFAFELLSDPATFSDPFTRAELVQVLARSAGPGGMVGGQAMDIAAETAAFDLQAVCTGFAYALATAEKFIRSGSHRRALAQTCAAGRGGFHRRNRKSARVPVWNACW